MEAIDIGDARYLRERIDPRPGDPLYLHLSDLMLALSKGAATNARLDLLDYGSGGSPYRPLFPNAAYLRADLPGAADADFEIGADGRIDAEPARFDLILSTQVLEHVPDAAAYLRNCFELLRPGGKLVLSTHGTFEDHACPRDYRRWTADGLKQDVAAAGFRVASAFKLTTEGRALAFLLRTKLHLLAAQPRDGFGVLFRAVQRILRWMPAAFDAWCDRRFSRFRCADSGETGHAIYIALLLVAYKPRV